MGNNKRKRKSRLISSSDETPQNKTIRVEDPLRFLDDIHEEPAKLLSDLLSERNLVFIKGSVGCGKTSLVKRIGNELDIPVKVIQLSDQIDSKTFIGNYQCTEVPGEFVWNPSEFSEHVMKKCLILLEDLDSASPDLVSSLLLMSKTWGASFKSEEELTKFHPEMRIVATVRSENNHSESSELIRSNPLIIELPCLTTEELQKIINFKYPNLKDLSEKLLKIFGEVSVKIKENSLIDRDLNSSDLMRLCQRLSKFDKLDDNHLLFTELSEVFVISIANLSKRLDIAKILGKHLSIPDQRIEFYLFKHAPEIIVEDSRVKFGRITLPVNKGYFSGKLSAKKFGLTLDARILIERIAVCIQHNEAVLLTGETGVGKTSVVQLIASYMNIPLEVVNMSQDSDSTDLIGGFKPIGTLELLSPFINDMDTLFKKDYEVDKNAKFLNHFAALLQNDQYNEYLELCELTAKKIIDKKSRDVLPWVDIMIRARRLRSSLNSRKSALPFAYVEGVVSKAAKNGHWLLVDEINLASNECLDAIIHVLDGVIECHPDFRMFGCMNPATDTGKKKLAVGIRSRFTEFFVQEPKDRDQLSVIIRNYLSAITSNNLMKLLNFYEEAIKIFPRKYSLRNLCRALSFASNDLFGNSYRSLFEGISMAFGSDLDNDGTVKFDNLLKHHFDNVPSGNPKRTPGMKQILIEGSFIEQGDNDPVEDPNYVYTPSVKQNLSKLSRIISSGKFPVLIEGETSAGKTSMVMHLAKVTGNVVHRINNHEHTDIQEYIGCYAPNENGKLTFVEGVLLQAVRNGHWVILDELNLAPVEVLEALNRLLDDNRELFVAERNMTVQAHPRFRLFATQNPVGTYAGRKRLSRAFLNRFVVLRFDHPPFDELATIVCARCAVPNSAAVAMIKVLTELKNCRSQTGIFNSSDGLMTLRDLFRWANRLAKSDSGEWRQVLADQGYFLLVARCRNPQDGSEIVRVLEKILKVEINTDQLFAPESKYIPIFAKKALSNLDNHVVSTYSMRRMLVLCSEAWRCAEPVLMVGETGCGKTTAAQILSEDALLSINCHERTETSDLLGSIRPNSDGSFFWQDGVVIQAMKNGSKLLIDEISLAADSVLERLNPLLEPTRTVLLTDAGADAEVVVAHEQFQVVATMNPGTDHGKKELSKALRNRFTEIWCSCDHPVEDIKNILLARMILKGINMNKIDLEKAVNVIIDFFIKFNSDFGILFRTVFSIRDIIAAADLFVACIQITGLPLIDSLMNCLSGVVLDSIGVMPARTTYDTVAIKDECLDMLKRIITHYEIQPDEFISEINEDAKYFGVFPINYGPLKPKEPKQYSFNTPTTNENVIRVARALLLNKPIMLEGNPGAGKSSLIVALAEITGYPLVRLNLSDQTDLSDLFGHDVPITRPDGSISFQWQDGPVLKAIKEGSWILLDEMNLASQSVLEGLNSCFDFRQELFIAELNKTFTIDSSRCRFFACQNPQQQGGNRRALPKSFLNRFTSIYVEPFKHKDFLLILEVVLPRDKNLIKRMVLFNKQMQKFVKKNMFDFEFNMRDLLRWAGFIKEFNDVAMGVEVLYVSRFPSHLQEEIREIYSKTFGQDYILPQHTVFFHQTAGVCFGDMKYNLKRIIEPQLDNDLLLLPSQMKILQKLTICINMNWLVLLNGPRLSGKSSIIEILAKLSGNNLKRMKLNKETDASELLGTYEQVIDDALLNECVNIFMDLINNGLNDIDRKIKANIKKELNELNSVDIRTLRFKIDQLIALTSDSESMCALEELTLKVSKIYLRFEWKSSLFVEAFRNGDWLLIEDVNCCSAAVLDRLNTCLESDGKLVLPEQADGSVEEIEPHPNFKIFFTMDSRNGSLSRAMKNRSVEFTVDETNSWYGDANSALNVLLRKEKTMCCTVDDEVIKIDFDNNSDIVKKSLLISTLNRITEEERLRAIDPELRLLPGDKMGLRNGTDKITLLENGLYNPRRPDNLLHPLRELRCPQIGVTTYSANSNSNVIPNVLISERKVQEFDRLANTVMSDEIFNKSEYSLAGFYLALLSAAPEALIQSSVFNGIFKDVKSEDKSQMTQTVITFIQQHVVDSSSPWDIRFHLNSAEEFINEKDSILVELLAKWLMHEAKEIEKRIRDGSPLRLSIDFNAKKGGCLGILEYKNLSSVCNTIVQHVSSLDFKKLPELNSEVFSVIFNFIIDVAVLLHSASLDSSDVHQLLILRQSFQNMGIRNLNSRLHPVFGLLSQSLKLNESKFDSFEKFIRQLGVSNPIESEKLVLLMEKISPLKSFSTEDEYHKIVPRMKDLSEEWTRLKGKKPMEKTSLSSLVEGLSDFLTSYIVIKNGDLAYQNWLNFRKCNLQHLELISMLTFRYRSDKNNAILLGLLNTNFGLQNISPVLTNYQITSSEILLDILCKFWESFGFSTTSFSAIPIADLASASERISEYQSLIWTTRKIHRKYSTALKSKFANATCEYLDDNIPWDTLFKQSNSVFKQLVPPKGMIDPALDGLVKLTVARYRESILQLFTSFTNVFPAEYSSHPVLKNLHVAFVDTMSAIEDMESNQQQVYRISHLRFDDFALEFRNFFARWESVLDGYIIKTTPWPNTVALQLVVQFATKTNNMINLAKAFCEQLLFNYSDMPDIVLPVYSVLQCILVVLNMQMYLNDRYLNLRTIEKEAGIVAAKVYQKIRPSMDIFEDDFSLLEFSLSGRDGLMPMQFQLEIIKNVLSKRGCNEMSKYRTESAFDWLLLEWSKWFEKRKEKRAQMFIYKETSGNKNKDDEETMVDPEDLEIQAMLPVLDDDDFEASSQPQPCVVNRYPDAQDISELVNVFMNPKGDADKFLPTVWMINMFNHTDAVVNPHFMKPSLRTFVDDSVLMDHHLLSLVKFRENLGSKPLKRVINVYTENDKAEVIRCANAMKNLESRVQQVQAEFPEEANLKMINETVSAFLKLDCGIPQLKLANFVEKVLEKAELWQKISPRQYSLTEQLEELQDLLVDWRKMQVQSWHHILDSMSSESHAIALAMGYPLIETIMSWKNNSPDGSMIQNYLAMLIDWIQSSTLIDFAARLETADLLAKIIKVFLNEEYHHVADSILSIRFYFTGYLQNVEDKLKEKRKTVSQDLEDFVSIVKFHDLNLWSVKNSAEKAHSKLFRIIKKYKLEGNEQLSAVFLEFLPTPEVPLAIDVKMQPTSFPVEDRLNFSNFFQRFANILLSIPGIHYSEELYEQSSSFYELLNTDVVYNGENDEANEKIQGQALADRQKKFALLIKETSRFGIRSRRAAQLSSEDVLKSSLTMDPVGSGLDEEVFRSCAVVRNVIMRLFNQLNSNKQPHIFKQLSVQKITDIKGITEYGFYWLLNVALTFKKFDKTTETLKTFKEKFEIYSEVAKDEQPCYTISESMNKLHKNVNFYSEKIEEIGKLIVDLVNAAPSTGPRSTADISGLLSQLENDALHKEHPRYSKTTCDASHLYKLLVKFKTHCINYGNKVRYGIWIPSEAKAFISDLTQTLDEIFTAVKSDALLDYFNTRMKELTEYLSLIVECFKEPINFESDCPGDIIYIQSDIFQRKIQQIYRVVETRLNLEKAPIDVFKEIVLTLADGIEFTKEVSILECLIDQLTRGYKCSEPDMNRYYRLVTELYESVELTRSILIQFANWTATFYTKLGHVHAHILKKGLINAIPKNEEGESGGQGKELDNAGGENCGMGEGEGAKDVGNEIEETGQVDDLQNDDDNGKNNEPQDKPKDSETPLDMEDDFAADLENLDAEDNEKGDDDKEDEDEGEDQNEDWDKGNVDQPEENQLDPLLWDKPKPNDETLDDNADGADDQTDELAAKENDDTVPREDNKKEGDEEDEKEKEEDIENVNDVDANDVSEDEEPSKLQDEVEEGEENLDDTDEIENADGGEDDNLEEKDDETMDQNEGEEEQNEERNDDEGGQPEQMEVEDGAEPQPEETQSHQGQSSKDEKKKDQASGDADEQEMEKEEAEKSESTKQEKDNKGKDDKQLSKNTAANAQVEKKNVEEKVDEEEDGPSEMKKHAQPTEDDAMEVEESKDVDEAIENDEIDVDSNQVAHIADDNRDSRDQHVVQKSTIEEALSTRSQFEKLKPNYDDPNAIPNKGDEENEPVSINKNDEDMEMEPEEMKHTVIHVSTDFFDLSQQAVGKLNSIEADVDKTVADSNDPKLYSALSDSVSMMASELAENLRQIMEPSIANRLQGDYRTGKRLNMKRLVSYIASDYRKNHIWLRRTKKQQRNFQIMIAVDDSQSMGDNRMSEITCQSVCLIEKAFRQLEVGQLAICKYGQTVQILRDFTSAADAQDTLIPSLLSNLKFDQNKTDLLGLLSFASKSFAEAQENTSTSQVPIQMLVVIGDGHGVFAQGKDPLKSILKELEHQRITVLYVIVDGKNSVSKINYTSFENGKPKMIPYMSVFPFPFYALVRTVSTLPGTLAEAIRQWFEMSMQE